jgi:hypothetical protein
MKIEMFIGLASCYILASMEFILSLSKDRTLVLFIAIQLSRENKSEKRLRLETKTPP